MDEITHLMEQLRIPQKGLLKQLMAANEEKQQLWIQLTNIADEDTPRGMALNLS